MSLFKEVATKKYITGAVLALVVAVGVSVAAVFNDDAPEGTVASDGDSTNPTTEQLVSTDIQPGGASGDEDDTDVPSSDVQVDVEVDEEVLPDGVTRQTKDDSELQDLFLSGIDQLAVDGFVGADSSGDEVTTDQGR